MIALDLIPWREPKLGASKINRALLPTTRVKKKHLSFTVKHRQVTDTLY